MWSEGSIHGGTSRAAPIACFALLVLLPACSRPPSAAPSATISLETVDPATPSQLLTATTSPTPVQGGLYVDTTQRMGTISARVYGTNFGPWITIPYELLPQAEAAGVTYLRYPGGQWGDQNNLRGYQIDQFIELAHRMGAEPSISVRLPGGSAEQAADLVRYANLEHDYDIRYWSIGNEPSLYEDYDTKRYNEEWRAFALAMRAVDPDLILIGPDIHQYTGNPAVDPTDSAGRDWLKEFLIANGDMVDVVSIHRYPFPISFTGPPITIDQLRANSREWDGIIPNLRRVIRETTGRDLPVAVTEVNSHWNSAIGGEATPDSFYNAIWWGDVLGRLIRQHVDIVAHFALQSRAGTGGWGLLARYEVRPTYYVYQLYQRFGVELVYASSDEPDLSIYASIRPDDALTLIIINLGPKALTKPLILDGADPAGPAQSWLFDADHAARPMGETSVTESGSLTLPAQSISLYVIPIR